MSGRLRLLTLALLGCTLLVPRPGLAQMPLPTSAGMVNDRPAGPASEADLRAAGAAMDEGRAALKRGRFREAVGLFRKVLMLPENQYSAEAQELLGFACQKEGEAGNAQGIYEDYLRRYPGGEGSERVRQRLAAVLPQDDKKVLRDPPHVNPLPIGKFTKTDETTWTLTGSVSSFYIRDDSITQARDTAIAPNVNANADDHLVQQNEIFTTLDLLGTWNSASTSGKVRFSGGEEHRFGSVINAPTGDQVDQIGVAQASMDVVFKDLNLRTVLGRQTYNGDGIFGRFDGALISWQPISLLKIDLDGGIPANSRYLLPFGLSGGVSNQEFFGGAIGIGPLFGGLDASIYYNEGIGHWLVSREAVGTDIKYADPTKFVVANVDYDLRFQKLNNASLTGSWTLNNQSTLYGGANYERVPFLSTWNVLLNSPFATLYDFLKAQIANGQPLTSDQVNQLALAQTPVYQSVMLGYSYPISDKLTASVDATFANLSRTIVPLAALDPSLAQLATGNEYYATAQLIWTNLFREGDMYTTALHYAQQSTDRQYELDLNTRYPVTKDVMVSPRLRLGYSQYSSGAMLYQPLMAGNMPPLVATANITQYTVMPSVLVDWNITPQLQFEAEVGTQWAYSVQPGATTKDTEIFGTIGFRYTFDLDGSKVFDRSKPASPAAAAICRYTIRPDGSCSMPSQASAR